MRKLAGHTKQTHGKTALTSNHHASKGAKAGVNFMPGPTTMIKGDYEKNAATNAAHFGRIGMSKGPKGSYDKSAHSNEYHDHGHAVGSSGDDGTPHYDAKTYAEGRPLKGADTGPNFVPAYNYSHTVKAKHHPRGGSAHAFPAPMLANAHGFGHTAKAGPLRLSGHGGAHRLGSRSK